MSEESGSGLYNGSEDIIKSYDPPVRVQHAYWRSAVLYNPVTDNLVRKGIYYVFSGCEVEIHLFHLTPNT